MATAADLQAECRWAHDIGKDSLEDTASAGPNTFKGPFALHSSNGSCPGDEGSSLVLPQPVPDGPNFNGSSQA